MPDFQTLPYRTPFGVNVYLRSTQDVKTESYMCAKNAVPSETIDGATGQKVLQKGELMCKITSGPDTGKVGPFQTGATDGRQTIANFVGFNNTFLPWQLVERDVEVSCVYEAAVYAAACIERDASGARIPMSGANLTALTAKAAGYSILFH